MKNNSIQNSSSEVENERAILEYDPALLGNKDLRKNKSYSAEKNNEYTKSTSYDSTPNVGVGYTLVDEHVDYHNTMNDNEHVERRTFYKTSK